MYRKSLKPESVNRDLWRCAWRLRALGGELERMAVPDADLDPWGFVAASALAGETARWLGAEGWAYRRAAASAQRASPEQRRALRTAERFYKAAAVMLRNGARQQWGNLPGLLGVAAARALVWHVRYFPPPPEWRGDAVYYQH